MRKIFDLQAWPNDGEDGQRPSAELIVHRWTKWLARQEKSTLAGTIMNNQRISGSDSVAQATDHQCTAFWPG
jgi:hypothetical protein